MGMLVISRRKGESLWIGEDIKVMVVRDGNNVRIGIDAPTGVPILRDEVKQRQQSDAANAEAMTAAANVCG